MKHFPLALILTAFYSSSQIGMLAQDPFRNALTMGLGDVAATKKKAEARQRAARHVAARLFKGAQVRDGATMRLGVYLRDKRTAKDVWVVYRNSADFAFKSSDVLLVCKRTGRVLYEGSPRDEG